jgi:hypothetical protein
MPQTAITIRNGKPQRIVSNNFLSGPVSSPRGTTAKLRLWTFLLLSAAAILIVACVACFVFLRNQVRELQEVRESNESREAQTLPASAPQAPAPPSAVTPFPIATAKSAPPTLPVKATMVQPMNVPPTTPPLAKDPTPTPLPLAAPPKDLPTAKPAPTLAPKTGSEAKAAMQRDRVLETAGSLGAVHLYQSYLNVGLLADAVEHETYTKAEAAEVLSTITLLLETARVQMEKLENIELDAEDVKALKQAEEVAKLLKAQSDHLREHWASGDKLAIDRYHEVRKQSWSELAKVLGVNK